MKKKNEEITLKDIFLIFVPKIWLIALVAVICSAALALRTMFMTPDTYTTSSVFHINTSGAQSIQSIEIAENAIEVSEYTVRSTPFLASVISDINTNYGEEFANTITTSYLKSVISYSPLGRGLLRVSVTTSDPKISFAISTSLEELIPLVFTKYEPEGTFAPIVIQGIPGSVNAIGINPKSTIRDGVIGFVIGGVLSAVGVFVYSLLDTKIRSKKKIVDSFNLPVLAEIPRTRAEEPNLLGPLSTPRTFEAYNTLCSNARYFQVQGKCKKIAVTSAKSGENKSTLAVNFAVSLAENLRDKKILLIDADMRSSEAGSLIAERLTDPDNTVGLADYLTDNTAPTFNKTLIGNLSVITVGAPFANPAALLCSERFTAVMTVCEKDFDYVIIDTPPVNEYTDAQLIVSAVDGYILSAKAKKSTVTLLDKAEDTLLTVGANIFGVVLSDVK